MCTVLLPPGDNPIAVKYIICINAKSHKFKKYKHIGERGGVVY